jgi:hypothetical protein
MTLTMRNVTRTLLLAGAGVAASLYLMGACLASMGLI